MGTTLILHQVVRELLSSVHVLGECSFIEEGFLEQARGAGGQGGRGQSIVEGGLRKIQLVG